MLLQSYTVLSTTGHQPPFSANTQEGQRLRSQNSWGAKSEVEKTLLFPSLTPKKTCKNDEFVMMNLMIILMCEFSKLMQIDAPMIIYSIL